MIFCLNALGFPVLCVISSDLYLCYLFLFEVREKEENDTFVGDGGMHWRRLRRPEVEGV